MTDTPDVPEPSSGAQDTPDSADEVVARGEAVTDEDGAVLDLDAVEDDEDPDSPTLLEVLRGEVSEDDIPPEMAEQLEDFARGAAKALENVNIYPTAELNRMLNEMRRAMVSPAAEVARRALADLELNTSKMIAPIAAGLAAQVSPVLEGVNSRIRAQLAASMPTNLVADTLQPILENFTKSALPADALRNITLSQTALRNLYGADFDRIAGSLFDFQKVFQNIDWEALKTGWYPTNWDSERGPEQFEKFIELAREEGLPMTWVPNTDLTYQLLDASDATERSQLLVQNKATIIEDCRAVLAEFENPTYLVEKLGRALDACEAGYDEPAQALAASIIDTALRENFLVPSTLKSRRWGYKATVKERLHDGEDWGELPPRLARLVPTSTALLNILKEFWAENGDPVPVEPNRHAAAHAVTSDQYNEPNAIKFMMLAVAILAEAEYGGWDRLLAHTDAS